MNRDEIIAGRDALIAKCGEWYGNLELSEGVWTKPGETWANPRLARVLQLAQDLSRTPLSECRVLDLGCATGEFAIEFAMRGAETVGIEGREANIEKARFVGRVRGLDKLTFLQEDVRGVTLESHGSFDIVICSGILYHLAADDVCPFLATLTEMTTGLLVIDTHVALSANASTSWGDRTYHGLNYREHFLAEDLAQRTSRQRASLDNVTSFWFTRPSLINLLGDLGWTSVFECLWPPMTGIPDRGTFVGVRGRSSSPLATPRSETKAPRWHEGELRFDARPHRWKRVQWRTADLLERCGLSRPAAAITRALRRVRR